MNPHLKEKSISLRLEGYSYNEINKKLGIAKSTLSSWLREIKLPNIAIERLQKRVNDGVMKGLIKRNRAQTVLAQGRASKIRTTSHKQVGPLSKRELMIIGSTLYWAEGYKRLKIVNGKEITAHRISLTNSDPAIVKSFIIFLKDIMTVSEDKISIEMRLFDHIKAKDALAYWMNITGLKESRFCKPSFVISNSSQGKRPYNRLPYGTVQVIVSDTPLFYHLMGLIDGIKDGLNAFKISMPR